MVWHPGRASLCGIVASCETRRVRPPLTHRGRTPACEDGTGMNVEKRQARRTRYRRESPRHVPRRRTSERSGDGLCHCQLRIHFLEGEASTKSALLVNLRGTAR
eukprot:3844273-Prymnesium_polylepis.2